MARISGTIIFCLLKKSKHLLLIFRILKKVLLFISLRNPLILDMAQRESYREDNQCSFPLYSPFKLWYHVKYEAGNS